MQKVSAVITVALVAGITVGAQQRAPQASLPACPPSGYALPIYGVFGQNGGDGQTAYEVASPCIPQAVRDAAEAIGMGRTKPLGVKNVIGIMFSAEGTLATSAPLPRAASGRAAIDSAAVMAKVKADFQISYVLPAMRLALEGTYADGKPLKEIRVFNDLYAWNEEKAGVGAMPAPHTLAESAPLVKLTPFGALWSMIEAEGHAHVTLVNGRTVLSGTSPYDGIEVTTTLDADHRPVQVTAKANGRVYEATFADYRDTWEPTYLVIFPSRIRWTLDGHPLADLKVTAFKSNPYIVFPVPAALRPRVSN